MNPTKKIILAIGALLCVMALGYFLLTTFRDRGGRDEQPPSVKGIPVISSEHVPDQAGQFVYSRFRDLYAMDEKYVSLLAASASDAALDSMQKAIGSKEKILRTSIDSLVTADNSRDQDESTIFFRRVLDNRALLRLSNGSTGSANLHDQSNTTINDLGLALVKKTERIAELEKILQDNSEDAETGTADKGASGVRDRLQIKEVALSELQEKYNKLEQQNSSLVKKLGDTDNKNVQRSPASNVQEEEKVNELDAALRLAQVECNLTRADGREIIYNGKQRKALLEESLRILNSLSSSGNVAVQKQVKDKMAELKSIAAMIRD